MRRTTFLSRPEWIQQPWSSIPKSFQDLLLDILLKIPDIYSATDAITDEMGLLKGFASGFEVARKCSQLDAELAEWFSRYKEDHAGPLYWPVFSNLDSEMDATELGQVFPTSLRFPSFEIGETLVLYWTAQVLIHSHLCLLVQKLCTTADHKAECQPEQLHGSVLEFNLKGSMTSTQTQQPPLRQLLPAIEHHKQWVQSSAYHICQSVEYFFQGTLRSIGMGAILPPLLVVHACMPSALAAGSRQQAWVHEMIVQIQGGSNKLPRNI